MLSELAYADTGPVEQRRLKRWQLVNYLRVFDATSGELVGHLVDLTHEGIMLLGSETLPCEKEFHLRMQRLSDGNTTEIHLRAYSLWSKQDVDPHLYKTGFQLVQLEREQQKFLQNLISELGKEFSSDQAIAPDSAESDQPNSADAH